MSCLLQLIELLQLPLLVYQWLPIFHYFIYKRNGVIGIMLHIVKYYYASPLSYRHQWITDKLAEAWNVLKIKFKSKDPSKISIIRTQYNNYHMQEGQSMSSYITAMKEFKIQLEKMGETIANSTHAATLLRNVPESWRLISQTIWMITNNPDNIEERLEAHEADLNTIEIFSQADMAFTARSNPIKPSIPKVQHHGTTPTFNWAINTSLKDNMQQPLYHWQSGHSFMWCFVPGGSLAGQEPWGKKNINNPTKPTPIMYQNYPQGVLPNPLPPSTQKSKQTKHCSTSETREEHSNDGSKW